MPGRAPLLLMLEPRLVPVILVLFGLTVSLMMVRRYRHEVRLGEIGGPGQQPLHSLFTLS